MTPKPIELPKLTSLAQKSKNLRTRKLKRKSQDIQINAMQYRKNNKN